MNEQVVKKLKDIDSVLGIIVFIMIFLVIGTCDNNTTTHCEKCCPNNEAQQ